MTAKANTVSEAAPTERLVGKKKEKKKRAENGLRQAECNYDDGKLCFCLAPGQMAEQ